MAKRPQPPKHLDKIGQQYWRELAKQLAVTERNEKRLEVAAEAYSTYRQASVAIQQDGLTVFSASGTVKPHPCIAIKERAVNTLTKILKDLYKENPEVEGDPLDEFLGG
ncbi:P27 family phage terminase small subunit [Bremerella sp. P1]|uniref:P27 family phage terminase small subunit n=1 Tax=Bremerella sp. P1 TaxID=3026424 RepID=UPI002368EECC|nr:P27 family phage terminase small subunit [Bremerella sp. P1]WDI41836.1 P27 family phage terminase small subunit [Bremerella sp. P1]